MPLQRQPISQHNRRKTLISPHNRRKVLISHHHPKKTLKVEIELKGCQGLIPRMDGDV